MINSQKYDYTRSGNPTREVLETCIAALENGKHAMCFSSGLGTSTTILALLKSGEHLLSGDDLYGGTNRLFRKLSKQNGFELDFVEMADEVAVKKGIKPNTKVSFVFA